MDILCEILRADNPVDPGAGRWLQGECPLVREFTPALRAAVNGACYVPRKAYLVVNSLPPLVTDIQQVRDFLDRGEYPLDDASLPAISRRLWFVDISAFNPNQQKALQQPPYYLERTWAQIRGQVIKQKGTGRYLDNADLGA